MNILLNKAHYPVTSLGPGRRIAIWFQGCSIGCKGCVSVDTWKHDKKKGVPIESLLAWCKTRAESGIDGITVSGGEPFEQPDALYELVSELQRWSKAAGIELDILCYSGLDLYSIERDYSHIVELLDAIISEPFLRESPTERYLVGSENQKITTLTALGKERYGQPERRMSADVKRLDIHVTEDSVWFAGIPRGDDLSNLNTQLETRGIKMRKVSWRA